MAPGIGTSAPRPVRRFFAPAAAAALWAVLAVPVLAFAQASAWVRPPTPEDERRAAEWVRFSAENGEPWAQYMLGTMLEFGRSMPADPVAALEWYLKAAVAGDMAAQYRCGVMYHEGRGTARNDAEAAAWLRKAADADNADAQALLGTLYAFGDGVATDEAAAVAWWTRAARSDQPDAQFNLAGALAAGHGTAPDRGQAADGYAKAAWGFLAAGRGDDARRALKALVALDPGHAEVAALTAAVAAGPAPGAAAP
jgi:TPR repeat protein